MITWTKEKVLIILGIIGIATIATAGTIAQEQILADLQLKAPPEKILESREIDWMQLDMKTGKTINRGKVVQYSYITDIEVLQEENEDISRRTGNTKVFKTGNKTKDGKDEIVYRIYTGTPFKKVNDKWYKTRTATTTPDAFNQQMGISLFEKVFAVFAAEYPTGVGDGRVWGGTGSTAWDTAHDMTPDGTGASYTDSSENIGCGQFGTNQYQILRGFIPIDTSAIDDDVGIASATLNVYTDGKINLDNDGKDYIQVVQANQANTATLATGDYDECGKSLAEGWSNAFQHDIIEGATAIDLGDISVPGWETWTLNATGRGWISKTGYTKLGLREGHDLEDVALDAGGDQHNLLQIRFSEHSSGDYSAYLEITTGAADSCDCPSGENWVVNSSDNCWISTDCDITGYDLILMNTGEGAFNIYNNAKLWVSNIQSTSTNINVYAGSKIYKDATP